MKNKFLFLSMALYCTLIFSGCAKDGETGPQGPAGAAGAAGNANVIATNTFTASWVLSGTAYGAELSVPAITQDIVDRGSVQVFVQYADEWWGLPDLNGVNSTQFGFGLGNVSLLNTNSDGTTPSLPFVSIFRVVVISSSNRMANPNVNWKNYKEIKQAFNLKD